MGTFQVNGNVVIADLTSARSPALTFQRSQAKDTYTDWRLLASAGNLNIQHQHTSGDWITSLIINENMQNNGLISTNYSISASSFIGSLQGNADTASKWKTARTLTVGNQSNSIDGSSNISYSVESILMTNTTINSTTDWNTVLNAGGYRVHGGNGFTAEYNGPVGAYAYGGLYVLGKNNTDHWPIHQIYIPHTTSASGIWYRSGWAGRYNSSWNLILDSNNYTKYTVTKGGSGASGTWGINITGNAATATKLTGLTASVNELNYISGATSNIQDQLTENANSISTLTATVSNKVDKVSGKGLSTNDYTTNEKNKLAGIAAGANKTTVDSALSSTSTNPVQNKVVNAAITNAAEVSVGTTQPTSSNVKVWYDTSASTVKTKVKNGNTFTELQGVSGVYVGTGTMPSGYNVQINPAGEATSEFAPAGYGLGDVSNMQNIYNWATLNAATASGWYYVTLALNSFSNSVLRVDSNDDIVIQHQFAHYNGLWLELVRSKIGGWSDWEWVNPPMTPGVEYRTTERWNGKPVYTKLVDFGELPNTSTKVKESVLPTNITAISATGYAKTATTSKIITSSDVMIEVNNEWGHIVCITRANISGSNAYIAVKYIKN